MTKPRIATVWLDGCSGCHMSFLDMDERLLEIAERADIVYSPLIDIKVLGRTDSSMTITAYVTVLMIPMTLVPAMLAGIAWVFVAAWLVPMASLYRRGEFIRV